jgi:hypothetical protein
MFEILILDPVSTPVQVVVTVCPGKGELGREEQLGAEGEVISIKRGFIELW